VTRVAALILHAPARPGDGPLTRAFADTRRANGVRHADGFLSAGADDVTLDDAPLDDGGFGQRVRAAAAALLPGDGLIVVGSGAMPLATSADRAAFVAAARAPGRTALANNHYSADVLAVSDASVLSDLPDLASDNALPRWLTDSAGVAVSDLARRWRLQVDLDTPLDAILTGRTASFGEVDRPARVALERVRGIARDPRSELLVAGRTSAATLRWLERSTASRTRALIEERGMRTRRPDQRPVASTLGLLLERDGPAAFGALLGRLGDGALVDTRVLLAQRHGDDERRWPPPEDRFASDLLLVERIEDRWLRDLTASARDAPIPVVLGGHTLVGPGLRLALGSARPWT
jgi:CTP:molybdopterin cytidylyltransferase MocA